MFKSITVLVHIDAIVHCYILCEDLLLRALGNERDPLDRSLQCRQTDSTQNGNERGKDSTREDVTDGGHVTMKIYQGIVSTAAALRVFTLSRVTCTEVWALWTIKT